MTCTKLDSWEDTNRHCERNWIQNTGMSQLQEFPRTDSMVTWLGISERIPSFPLASFVPCIQEWYSHKWGWKHNCSHHLLPTIPIKQQQFLHRCKRGQLNKSRGTQRGRENECQRSQGYFQKNKGLIYFSCARHEEVADCKSGTTTEYSHTYQVRFF